jgi:OCT family organic cation transporter-like MFS transporter 4/5
LLCEPKWKIGLLGSIYFAGVVVTILFIPIMSDRCFGRRNIFLILFAIFILAFIGLIVSKNLIETYVFLFIMGACFAGRIVVGITYLLELLNPIYAKKFLLIFFFSEPVLLILLTMWYQFIDRSWYAIFIITLVFIIIAFFWYLFFVPESPKWLYTFKYYDESRKVLSEIAEFNGVAKEDY